MMELKENFVNDPTEVVTVDSTAPAVVATATDEGAKSLALNASDLSKKLVEKEMRQPFPVKVYEMLENAESKEFSHIVSWNADGTGFMVHDKEYFTKEIVPHYFNLTKYKSFQRQLSLYGFQRVTVGENKGLRFHAKLRKGQAELVREMKPVGYKPRNPAKLLEQKKKRQQEQTKRGTNILTTTTTTVVKTTTTSTTLMPNVAVPRDVTVTVSDASVASLPPVVSSNSLTKQEDHEDAKQSELTSCQVHSISPETTHHSPLHPPSDGVTNECHGNDPGQFHFGQQTVNHAEPEIVDFEGKCFYLMSPTRELGIHVKLKLLEEFNPASSLLQIASKYVTTDCVIKSQTDGADTTIPNTIPITIDTVYTDRPSLLDPYTDFVAASGATSTASAIAALRIAASSAANRNNESISTVHTTTVPLTSFTTSDATLDTNCIDTLDFHSMNIANKI